MLIVRFVLRKMPFPALHLIILDAESSLYFQINYMSILSGALDFLLVIFYHFISKFKQYVVNADEILPLIKVNNLKQKCKYYNYMFRN